LPFDADGAVAGYQLGLPTAMQHALNQIPGVYVPPIGDAALMANKAADTGQEVEPLLVRVFNADAVVTGRVVAGGGGVMAEINVMVGGAVQPTQVQGAGPAELAAAAAEAVAKIARPSVSADALASLRVSAEQTPSVASLGPVGLAASGLPGARVDQLNTASQLDSGSAWVIAEYARTLALAGAFEEAVTQARRASDLAPNDAEVQALVGVVLEAAGDDGALAAFERALTVNPAHAVALAGRAAVNADAAQASTNPSTDLEGAIAAYPRFVDAYVRLANRQPDLQRAIQTLRRAESYSPESVLLRGSVMQRLIDSGDASGALAYLRQVVAEPLARSASMYALARLLPSSVAQGAADLLNQGLEAYPNSVELQLAQADLRLQAGDPAAALAILEPLHADNPTNIGIANLLAVAQAESGDLDGARATFEGLRELGVDVELGLAELYLASGRASGALEILEPLVAAQPEDAYLQALYGTALMRQGRLSEGEQVLERALQLEPGNALASRSLELLRQQRELTGGDVAFSEEAGVAFQQGLASLDQHDYTAAVEAFGRSRAAQETGLAAFYQGYSRQLLGQTRPATQDYQVALETFPDSDIVLNNMGYAQMELGRFDLALDYLRRAIAANPNNPQAHLNLGVTYYAVQRYEDAIAEFAEAGRLDPSIAATTETLIEDVRERLGER
jgi:Flp pilus assembly protein TadD